MSDYIPADLLANVLLRLPLESLLRSRCVSKSWRALIDSPHFIKLHFNKSVYALKPNSHDDDDIKVVVFSHDEFFTLQFKHPVDSSIATAKQLNFPLKHPESEIQLVGSYNGLILSKNSRFRYCPLDGLKSIGYSPRRLIGDFPFQFAQHQPDVGALANGALHWTVKAKEWDVVNSILIFDLKSEEFRLIPLPRNPIYTFLQNLRILNGSLCLLSYYYSSGRYRVDLWEMEEYGAWRDESWKKLISIKMPCGIQSLWYITPVSYLKNKRKVVLQIEREKLVVYDLLTKSMM